MNLPPFKPQSVINLTGAVIALGVLGILGFAMWALVYIKIPSENQTPMVQMVGNLNTLTGIIVGWFFGSSSQAKTQTDTIETLARTAQTAQAALPAVAGAPVDTLVIPPGGSATATATEGGTEIKTDP